MTLDEQIILARHHGAKLHRWADGLWSVLDQSGTLLWLAYFRDEATAAWAYCFQHGLALTAPAASQDPRLAACLAPGPAMTAAVRPAPVAISPGTPIGDPVLAAPIDISAAMEPPVVVACPSDETALSMVLWSLLLRATQENVMLIQDAHGFQALAQRGLAVAEDRDIGFRNKTPCIALTEAGRTALATFI